MASSGDTVRGEHRSRIDYIKEIIQMLSRSIWRDFYSGASPNAVNKGIRTDLLPSAAEVQSFEEVLRCVVRVVSSNECPSVEGTPFTSSMQARGTTNHRKQCLKKILSQLRWMERERLYCPPADNEIGYYLVIKKYMRSILGFFHAAEATSEMTQGLFGCVQLLEYLYPSEKLAEVNQHLADLAEVLLTNNAYDGFTLKPIMVVGHNRNIAPLIHGSKEKGYQFYMHQLNLALIDLRFSEHAYVPPLEYEKTSYVHLLNSVSQPLNEVEDKVSIYSDVLDQIFLERICQETKDITRHCRKIKSWILKNLSLTECWESIIKQYDVERFEDLISDECFPKFRNALAEKCEVSNKDLPNYICRLDCCLTIADSMLLHVMDCLGDVESMLDTTPLSEVEKAWGVLHALTLLKRGSYVGNVIREKAIMKNQNEQVFLEHVSSEMNKEENVLVLRRIIEDLECIGDSNVALDEEELVLVQKIWGSVASSTHFFTSALAYEQKHYWTHHIELFDGLIRRMRTPLRKKQRFDKFALSDMRGLLVNELIDFANILELYKDVLVGRGDACNPCYN